MRARVVDNEAGAEQMLYPIWATKRTIHELLGVCYKVLYLLAACVLWLVLTVALVFVCCAVSGYHWE